MNFEEHAAKSLVLAPAGIPVPRGQYAARRRKRPKRFAQSDPP